MEASLVTMFRNKVQELTEYLERECNPTAPHVPRMDHCSHIGHLPRGKLGPLLPQRIMEHEDAFVRIRSLFDAIQRVNDVGGPQGRQSRAHVVLAAERGLLDGIGR